MMRTLISVPEHKTRTVLNCLHGRGIEVFKGKIKGGRWQFSIDPRSAVAAESVLNELGIDYNVIRKGGKKLLADILKLNAGLIIAAVLAVIAAAIGSQFVFGADVIGDDPAIVASADEAVKEMGLSKIGYKRKIDTEQIKSSLYANVERLAFVSVKVRGSRIKISTVAEKEMLPEEKM
ncbi:MAG: sporulation protein YqfD, partial [Clostridia bacterium]|nr:sporulation protein YqfD [Clostridia bacterium]